MVKIHRSDRGTNFIYAANKLRINVINIEEEHLLNFFNEKWQPGSSTSHMGGMPWRMQRDYETYIGGNSSCGSRCLTQEVLTTFLAEATSIINSRPLVLVSRDPENPLVLSHSTLRLQYSNDLGNKNKLLQTKKRRVQHFASPFWKLWKTEYLNTLQIRRKLDSQQRQLSPGD